MSMLKKLTAPPIGAMARMGDCFRSPRKDNTYLISGSPRGGTTWLAESMARALHTRRLRWEPLQDGNNALPESLRISKRPFIEPNSVIAEQEVKFFDELMNGKQANAHLLRLRQRPLNLFALFQDSPLLVKFVRGNGVLGYLHQRYKIPKPVVIIRHPCAVVASQLHMGNWDDHPHINHVILERHPRIKAAMSGDKSLHERLAITWACDVLAAREHSGHIHIIYYEHLVQQGAKALAPVLDDWGLPPTGMDEALQIPSSTIHGWTDLNSVSGKLQRWKGDLSVAMVDDILATVEFMGVNEYGREGFPATG